MKWRSSTLVSSPIQNLEKFVKLNFYCNLNFGFIFNVHCILIIDVCGKSIYTMMFFTVIFTHNEIFRFLEIIFYLIRFFLQFFFKKLQKIQFSLKKSEIFVEYRGHVVSSLKNRIKNFHTHLVTKWKQTEWRTVSPKTSDDRPSVSGLISHPLIRYNRVHSLIKPLGTYLM